MLLLLAIVAGNLAVVTVNKALIDDVDAVAEWRIDGDSAGGDLGGEPELPAALTSVRDSQAFLADPDLMPRGDSQVIALGMGTHATRAPPTRMPA